MYEMIRNLDQDQRKALDVMYQYASEYKLAERNRNNPWPKPPLLMVHGGAGSGKSHLIATVAQLLEKTFRTPGDDINAPYILKLAFTGNAASIIHGQTIHSAFQLPFSNKHVTLHDKLRDLRRKQLKNIRLVIIDEISLVKSDMLYQIHFRLIEILQNTLDFGNVAILALGDILQIKPPMGRMIFNEPYNHKSKMLWNISGGNLWQKFSVITLKTNHRQGDDKSYADLLNRIRVGKHTDEDIKQLESRVFPRGSPELPMDALVITGENRIVNEINENKINELTGELKVVEAVITSKTRNNFKPKVDKAGQVKNTPLQLLLKMKKNARVMLTSNIDVCDNLTNGSMGTIVDFIMDNQGNVNQVLVVFDDPSSGENSRKLNKYNQRYPGLRVTAIKQIEFDFQIRDGSSSTATATNFPLRLAWASTCHKIQVNCNIMDSSLSLNKQDPGSTAAYSLR